MLSIFMLIISIPQKKGMLETGLAPQSKDTGNTPAAMNNKKKDDLFINKILAKKKPAIAGFLI